MTINGWLKQHNITAPAVLLFTALLAQAPHAAAVFMRIAPHDQPWEVYTSFVGAWVYAIALEGATAYFVWKNQRDWAIGFALFSVAHNVAYYMPATWTFYAWGTELTVRNTFSAVLISVSLPVAIAAFSHVQAQVRDSHTVTDAPKQDVTPAGPVTPDVTPTPAPGVTVQDVTPADVTPGVPSVTVIDKTNKTQLAKVLGVTRQTVGRWEDAGVLDAKIAEMLPQAVTPHTNGYNHVSDMSL